MMHIAIAGDYPQSKDTVYGGVEAVVFTLARELRKDPSLIVDIVTLDRKGRERSIVDHGRGSVYYIPASQLPSRLSIRDNIHRLRKELLRLRPDLVHVHITNEYAQATLGTGLPWVLTLHGIRHLEAALKPGLVYRYREWFVRKDEFQVVRAAGHVIMINPFVKEAFSKQIQGRVFEIENPVSEAYFHIRSEPVAGRILFVGALIPRKDLLTLLKAVDQLQKQFPQVTLHLAGGGRGTLGRKDAYLSQLHDHVDRAGLKSTVTFLGQLEEPALLDEYAKASVVVLSSLLETAPMAVMQAMAAAKPVVSTDAGGTRYLIEDGASGFIVPLGDADALAEALLKLLVDDLVSVEMGGRARKIAESRFRAKLVTRQTVDVYREILAGGSSDLELPC